MQELHWKDEGMRWHKQFILSELALLAKYFLLIFPGALLLCWLLEFTMWAALLPGIFMYLISIGAVWRLNWYSSDYSLQGNRLSVTLRNPKDKTDQVDTFELADAVVRREKVFNRFTFLLIKVKQKGYYVYVENGSEAQRQLMAQLSGSTSTQ